MIVLLFFQFSTCLNLLYSRARFSFWPWKYYSFHSSLFLWFFFFPLLSIVVYTRNSSSSSFLMMMREETLSAIKKKLFTSHNNNMYKSGWVFDDRKVEILPKTSLTLVHPYSFLTHIWGIRESSTTNFRVQSSQKWTQNRRRVKLLYFNTRTQPSMCEYSRTFSSFFSPLFSLVGQ